MSRIRDDGDALALVVILAVVIAVVLVISVYARL